MAAVLEASGVTRVYGKGDNQFTALRGVDVRVAPGESVAVIGKSGSGKSTLMHILAGLDRPTQGSVRFGGTELATLPAAQLARVRNERFSFVFQQFFLMPRESVLDNVAQQLKIRGVSRRSRSKAAMVALDRVGLADKAANRATDLSGGQKQRVAVARALVARPAVLFADEPSGNLDSSTGEAIKQLLFDVVRDAGASLVLVTHDEEYATACDRVVEVHDGLIVNDHNLAAVRARGRRSRWPDNAAAGVPGSGRGVF